MFANNSIHLCVDWVCRCGVADGAVNDTLTSHHDGVVPDALVHRMPLRLVPSCQVCSGSMTAAHVFAFDHTDGAGAYVGHRPIELLIVRSGKASKQRTNGLGTTRRCGPIWLFSGDLWDDAGRSGSHSRDIAAHSGTPGSATSNRFTYREP